MSDTPYRYARLIAWFSWLVVGASDAMEVSKPNSGLTHTAVLIWFAAFAAFGPALFAPFARVKWLSSPHIQIARLGVATIAPMIMVAADPRSFACALLVIVAWELAIALPMSVVRPWIVVQTCIMTALLVRAWSLDLVLPEIAIYLAFQGYAVLTASVARSEAEARKSLSDAHRELKAAQGMLAQSVRMGERLSLARELHDLIGHHLSALVMNLEVAKHTDETPVPYVLKAQELARQLLTDVRNIVKLTRGDERVALKDLLNKIVEDIPRMDVHLTVADDAVPETPEQTNATLRIIQEAATNAMRHSGCANLWIDVSRQGHDLRITARDDGVGAPRFHWGSGLGGMRERLAELGGRLTVVSEANPGFRIMAELPMARSEN